MGKRKIGVGTENTPRINKGKGDKPHAVMGSMPFAFLPSEHVMLNCSYMGAPWCCEKGWAITSILSRATEPDQTLGPVA
eukprot:1161781-Pelagomonas_calceolata.AAC.8